MNPQDDIAGARAAITALRDAGNAATLAAYLHSAYEIEAVRHGWATQTACRVPFDELPPANRATMIGVAEAMLAVLGLPAICELLLGHLDAHEAAEAQWEIDFPGLKPIPSPLLDYMRTLAAKLAAMGRGM